MENQHRRIAGYRELSQIEIDLMNDIKRKGEELKELLSRVGQHVEDQHAHAQSTKDITEMERLTEADPLRWHADAKHSLQSGIMMAVRAVAQPTTF